VRKCFVIALNFSVLLCPCPPGGGIKRWCAFDVWRHLMSVANMRLAGLARVGSSGPAWLAWPTGCFRCRGRWHIVVASRTVYFLCDNINDNVPMCIVHYWFAVVIFLLWYISDFKWLLCLLSEALHWFLCYLKIYVHCKSEQMTFENGAKINMLIYYGHYCSEMYNVCTSSERQETSILWNIAGQDIQPKRDLSRFVRWPKYIRLQRQLAILKQRLKVPPTINQFTQALDRQTGMYWCSRPTAWCMSTYYTYLSVW